MHEIFRQQASQDALSSWLKQFDLSEQIRIQPGEYLVLRQSAPHQVAAGSLRLGLQALVASGFAAAVQTPEVYAEEITSTSVFISALKRRRCLIPATRIVEEFATEREGRPVSCFTPGDGGIFALAGIWDRWEDAEGVAHETFAVVSTAPAPMLRSLFQHMPVVIATQDYERWLDCSAKQPIPTDLLKPLSVAELRDWELLPDVPVEDQGAVDPVL